MTSHNLDFKIKLLTAWFHHTETGTSAIWCFPPPLFFSFKPVSVVTGWIKLNESVQNRNSYKPWKASRCCSQSVSVKRSSTFLRHYLVIFWSTKVRVRYLVEKGEILYLWKKESPSVCVLLQGHLLKRIYVYFTSTVRRFWLVLTN